MIPLNLIRSLSNIPKTVSPNLDLNLAGVDKFNRQYLKRALQLMTREGEKIAMGEGYGYGLFNPGNAISGRLATDNLYGTKVLEPLRAAIKDKKADPYELALQSIRTGSFGEGTKKISSAQRRNLLHALRSMERDKLSLTGTRFSQSLDDEIALRTARSQMDKSGDLITKNILDNSSLLSSYNSPALTKKLKKDMRYYNIDRALKSNRGNQLIDILSKGDSEQKQLANNLRPLVNMYNENYNKWGGGDYFNPMPFSDYTFDVKPIREATASMMNPSMKQFIDTYNPFDIPGYRRDRASELLQELYTKLPDSPRSRETAAVLLKDAGIDSYSITKDKIDEIINMARLLEEGM